MAKKVKKAKRVRKMAFASDGIVWLSAPQNGIGVYSLYNGGPHTQPVSLNGKEHRCELSGMILLIASTPANRKRLGVKRA